MTPDDTTHVTDWLLQADLAELRNPPAHIALHVDSCLRCQSDRAAVLRGYSELDTGLDQLVRRRQHHRVWPLIPLAAAAVAAALLLTQREKAPVAPSAMLAELMFPQAPLVTPPAGKQAMILENNDLTVVWLY